jgi:hypothetical protein
VGEELIALVAAAAGFILKGLFDAWVGKRKELELAAWRIRADTLAARLAEFYWPIYLRLQRDNIVWEKILDRDHADEDRKQLAHKIEELVLLPNHEEVVSIIERAIHLAGADPPFEKALLAYVRHVDIYRSLRAAGIRKDPLRVGEPYPSELFSLLRDRLAQYQGEYDELLRQHGIEQGSTSARRTRSAPSQLGP